MEPNYITEISKNQCYAAHSKNKQGRLLGFWDLKKVKCKECNGKGDIKCMIIHNYRYECRECKGTGKVEIKN